MVTVMGYNATNVVQSRLIDGNLQGPKGNHLSKVATAFDQGRCGRLFDHGGGGTGYDFAILNRLQILWDADYPMRLANTSSWAIRVASSSGTAAAVKIRAVTCSR